MVKQLLTRTLVRDLLVAITAALLIVGTTASLFNYWFVSRYFESHLESDANQLLAKLQDQLKDDIWNLDESSIAEYVNNHPLAKDVVFLSITNQFGGPIFSKGSRQEEDVIVAKAPVRRGQETIGFIELGFSRKQLGSTATFLFRNTILTLLISYLVMIVLIWIMLRLFLHRPIGRLTAGINEITVGNYERPIAPVEHRELDQIRADINQMAASIRDRTMALQYEISERKEMGDKLNEAKNQAEKGNQAKSMFLANISHELRTPLNAVIGFSSILLDNEDTITQEKRRQATTQILKAGEHLLGLINDVLDFSKMEAGRLALDLTEIDIQGALEQSICLMQPQADLDSVTIELEQEEPLGTTNLDRRRFMQVLYNLLSNAVKFSSTPGKVILRAKKLTRDNEDGAPHDILHLEVQDSGKGIHEEHQEQIFQPFEQLASEAREKGEGTGLGLAITRKIVELHNGTISVSSKLGQGSCFTVEIPYVSNAKKEGADTRIDLAFPV